MVKYITFIIYLNIFSSPIYWNILLVYLHAIRTWQGARNSFRHVISLFINIDAILKCKALWSSQGKKNTIEKPLLLEEYTMRKNIAMSIALLQWVTSIF